MYTKLQWRFSKVDNYSGVSQIRGNCNGVYPINPKIFISNNYLAMYQN
jgi:hypothetical protein